MELVKESILSFTQDINEAFGDEQFPGISLYVDPDLEVWTTFVRAEQQALKNRQYKSDIADGTMILDLNKLFSLTNKEESSIFWQHLWAIAFLITEDAEFKQLIDADVTRAKQELEKAAATPTKAKIPAFDPSALLSMMNGNKLFQNLQEGKEPNVDMKAFETIPAFSNLGTIVQELEKEIKPDASPTEAFQAILTNPSVLKLVENLERDIKSGDFDPNQILQVMGNML